MRILGTTASSIEDGQIVTSSLRLSLEAFNQLSFGNRNFVSAKIYSVYNGGLRSSNYTVQYSDDGSTWTTAWTGVATNNSSCGLVQNTGSGNGSYGARRYWRYVEGSAVVSHHPRVSRIILTDENGNNFDIVNYTSDNCADSGTYIVGTVTYDSYLKWNDLSVNGFSATLQNGTTFSGLDGSGCFILDGANDYISLPTSGFGAASFSLEWWIKKTSGADVDGHIHVTDSFDNPETRFFMNATSFVATVYDGGAYRWNTSVATITTDTWYHAVATLTNGSQKFYVNGVETATNSGFYDGSGGDIGEHTFGTYNRPGAGYGGYFAGKLAAYRYYTKVLTAQEVLQNFNARKWRFGF